MPTEELPPRDVFPGQILGLEPTAIHVCSYSPGRLSERVPAAEVHLLVETSLVVEGVKFQFAVRFRGPETLDDVIDALIEHRREVFGERFR